MRLGPERGQNQASWRTLRGAKTIFQVIRETSEEWWIAADGSGEIFYGRDGSRRPAP